MTQRRCGYSSLSLHVVLLFSSAALPFLIGCTTTIRPPDSVQNPASVYLLDHGRTCSLLLPRHDDATVRYAYGDWNYYALTQIGYWDGMRALCWPTQGALGRMQYPALPDLEAVRRQFSWKSEAIFQIDVETTATRQLLSELDEVFEQNIHTLVNNRLADLRFVHHPEAYTYWNNSNRVMARWLRQLGCEVDGLAFQSSWNVEH